MLQAARDKLIHRIAKSLAQIDTIRDLAICIVILRGYEFKTKDSKLRERKVLAHKYIDWLWKQAGIPRPLIYKTVAADLGISTRQAHLTQAQTLVEVERIVTALKHYKNRTLLKLSTKLYEDSKENSEVD